MRQSPMLREIFERVAENSEDIELADSSIKKSQLIGKIKKIEADVFIIGLA
jgi:hypothetical protein